jgi:hypothetical protein
VPHKSTTDVAINLDMLLRVVQHVLKVWDDTGEVCLSQKGEGPLF